MLDTTLFTTNVLLAWLAYFIGTSSPGPSNLAIMGLAMNSGRRAALTFASGVICGSFFWALLATFGLSATLLMYAQAMIALKVLGGLYLLWLAHKSARSALKPGGWAETSITRGPASYRQLYARGLLMHLTNPKAILVWLSIMALAFPAGGGHTHAGVVISGCMVLAVLVFGSYALLFSTATARRLYRRIRRGFDAILAVVFAVAGVRLLLSRS